MMKPAMGEERPEQGDRYHDHIVARDASARVDRFEERPGDGLAASMPKGGGLPIDLG